MEQTHALNDNFDPRLPLALPTARVLMNEQTNGDHRRIQQEQERERHQRYIDYRLRELAAWERGLGISRRY